MTAIRFAMTAKFEAAACTILVAGVLDGLDGRVARLLKSTSHFGAELDSLSDFVSFGVAPAAVLYLWTMAGLKSFGWAIVLVFAVCCALRLARFNAQLAAEPAPYMAGFFTGMPAPAAAGVVIMPIFASFAWGDFVLRSPYLNAAWITGVAVLMVSSVPTVSLKRIRIPPHLVMPTLLGIGIFTAFMTSAPFPTLICLGLAYLGSIPLTVRAYWKRRRAAEARRSEFVGANAPSSAGASPPLPLAGGYPPDGGAPAPEAPPANGYRH
jgi:CDP-diacylglycerol--serine O-phosphatidyltransferase